jgi:hypothetical protein
VATFWAIVIGALFVIAVGAVVFLGARSVREQKQRRTSAGVLPSSRDKRERDRREARLERDQEQRESKVYEGKTRVYRN